MRKFIFLFLLLCIITSVFADKLIVGKDANIIIPGSNEIRLMEYSKVPNYVAFTESNAPDFAHFHEWFFKEFKISDKYNLKKINTERDALGFVHYTYKQQYLGKDLTFSLLHVHVKNGKVLSFNGDFLTNVDEKNDDYVSITSEKALDIAKSYIGAESYKWEHEEEEEFIKWEQHDDHASFFPKANTVYVPKDGDRSKVNQLAFFFDIYAQKPLGRYHIYIDAHTGEVLWNENRIHTVDEVGTAHTGYNGIQSITCDKVSANSYRLRESGRGNGIETYDMQNGTTYGNAADFTDNDNVWDATTIKKFGTDAHYGAEQTYDYYLSVHNRNSIDGAGFVLKSYVHYDNNFGNAFWDGQRMTYGDGSNGNAPFTALDIAGHEITHGLISNTANLVYQNESGALNESFADILGMGVEWNADPNNANWLMGEQLGGAIRSASNPNSFGHPDTYLGDSWYTGTADNGGVHLNSGVQNYWFYLLSVGGAGTNDLGNTFSVSGIGVEKAAKVAFRNLTVYLTPGSNYQDAYFYGMKSAKDLFGNCNADYGAVHNAYYAIGFGQPYTPATISNFEAGITSNCSAPFTVDFVDMSINANTYSWDFGDGSTSSLSAPSHTYQAQGTYNVKLSIDGGACGNDVKTINSYIVIGPSEPCIFKFPVSGQTTFNECSGVLFDDGGAANSYSGQTNSIVTIAPNNAISIELTVEDFDIEAGATASCEYDYINIYDGNSTSGTLIGKYCNSNLPPSSITVPSSAVTIEFSSDQALETAGFKLNWVCTTPNTPPIADFSFNKEETCSGVIDFTDASSHNPTSWIWDFGDGNTSTQQNPSHVYSTNGTYTVVLTAQNTNGSDIKTSAQTITVNLSSAPQVSGEEVCKGEIAKISAIGNGQLDWYNQQFGGTLIHSGDTLITPALNTSTTYFVESKEIQPISKVGKIDNSGPGGDFTYSQYLVFETFKKIELISVKVYASGAGVRTIELRDLSGAVLQTKSVNIPNGEQRVALNFVMPAGNYRLGVNDNSMINMFRNSSGANYPYTIANLVSITKSSASTAPTDYYYFFYDWEVREPEDCISPRVPVVALVKSCTGIDEYSANEIAIFVNSPENTLVIESDLVDLRALEMEVLNTLGQSINHSKLSTSETRVTIQLQDNIATGVYFVRLSGDNKRYIKKVYR